MFTVSSLDGHAVDGGLDLDLDWGSQGVLGQKKRTIRLRICRLSDINKSENLILSYNKRKSDLRIDRDFFYKKGSQRSTRRFAFSEGQSCGFVDVKIRPNFKGQNSKKIVLAVKRRTAASSKSLTAERIGFTVGKLVRNRDQQNGVLAFDSPQDLKDLASLEEGSVVLSTASSSSDPAVLNSHDLSGSATSAGTGGPMIASPDPNWKRKTNSSHWSISTRHVNSLNSSYQLPALISDIDHVKGHTLVAGRFGGAFSLGGRVLTGWPNPYRHRGTMRYYNGFISKIDSAGNAVWSTQLGGSHSDRVNAVEVFKGGTSRIGGSFQSSSKFGSIELIGTKYNPVGVRQFVDSGFVARVNTNGTFKWAKSFRAGASGHSGRSGKVPFASVHDLAIANGGITYVVGHYSGKLFYDNVSSHSVLLDSKTKTSSFLAKLKSDGKLEWIRSFGGRALAIEKFGKDSLIVVGHYSSENMSTLAGANSKTSYHQITSQGKEDGFVAKFGTQDGLSQWLVNVGGSGDEVVRAVTVKGSTIYVAANWSGDGISLPSFDGKNRRFTSRSSSLQDIIFASYDGSGKVLNAEIFRGDPNEVAGVAFGGRSNKGTVDLVSDLGRLPDGDIILAGATTDTKNTALPIYQGGSGTISGYKKCGSMMPFMVKYDPLIGSIDYNISPCASGSMSAGASAVAPVHDGSAILAGYLGRGELFFGNKYQRFASTGSAEALSSPSGNTLGFIAKATPSGEWILGQEAPSLIALI